jgi:predicted transcriptional regulator
MKRMEKHIITTPFSMRLEPDLRGPLEEFADADNRKLANYVKTVLRQHVEERRSKQQQKGKTKS